MYIDDNTSLTKLFLCLGKEYGFTALTAHSIKEGYVLIQKEMPDVIITDIYMPDGDGFSLTANIKTDPDPKIHSIPVIACSVTYAIQGKKIFLLGGTKFINDKPYSIDKLNEILEGVVPKLIPIKSDEKNKRGLKE
ncbi:MAG: response regulator [Candidatus Aureabacteria bacterium]|nr:response regulator [Candidatus Auribacterota bacterium]